jgi:hypothetical protein
LDLRDKDDPPALEAGAVAGVAGAGRFVEQPDILGPTVPRFDRQVALESFRSRGGHRWQK